MDDDWVDEVQRCRYGDKDITEWSLQTEDLNTLLGGQYSCIKTFYALCEPSTIGRLSWRQPECHTATSDDVALTRHIALTSQMNGLGAKAFQSIPAQQLH